MVFFITESKMDVQPIASIGTNLDERQYEEITSPPTTVNFEIDDPKRHKQTAAPAVSQPPQQPTTTDLATTSTVSTFEK